jgi:hypothetical protein
MTNLSTTTTTISYRIKMNIDTNTVSRPNDLTRNVYHLYSERQSYGQIKRLRIFSPAAPVSFISIVPVVKWHLF